MRCVSNAADGVAERISDHLGPELSACGGIDTVDKAVEVTIETQYLVYAIAIDERDAGRTSEAKGLVSVLSR